MTICFRVTPVCVSIWLPFMYTCLLVCSSAAEKNGKQTKNTKGGAGGGATHTHTQQKIKKDVNEHDSILEEWHWGAFCAKNERKNTEGPCFSLYIYMCVCLCSRLASLEWVVFAAPLRAWRAARFGQRTPNPLRGRLRAASTCTGLLFLLFTSPFPLQLSIYPPFFHLHR